MARILLVEDDPILGRGLKFSLEREGYEVTWTETIASTLTALDAHIFNLIALDLQLPDGTGLTIAKKASSKKSSIPVIMITASGDEESVIAGFSAGAADYVRKPFGTRELLARIKVVLGSKSQNFPFRTIQYCELSIQPEQRIAKLSDVPMELNRRQFQILSHLIANAEAVVTRDALISSLDKSEEMFDRTIDSHVSLLRSKLKKFGANGVQITSIYGVGYRLEKKA